MTNYLIKETEIVPWATALEHLSHWRLLLYETDIVPMLNSYIKMLISKIYGEVGWEDKGEHMER